MIHYSCDRCRRSIDPQDLRYVVKVEVQAAMETLEVDEADDDRDHLLEVQDILERLDDVDNEAISDELYQRCRFDLCPECFRQFMKNPIGQDSRAQFGFSQN
jgi:hypothetical protein